VTHRRQLVSSYSSTQRSQSRGLDYSTWTQWATPDPDSTQDTFSVKMTLQFKRKVLDSRLGGSVPRVLQIFLQIFQDRIGGTSD
jgi:hypothetical protein